MATSFEHAALVRGLQARNRLLLIHAAIGIEVGLFLAFTGAPSMIEDAWGPWARLALGFQSFGPGVMILVGMLLGLGSTWGRGLTFFGALGLLVWNICMAIIFIVQMVDRGVFLWPGEVMPDSASLSYVFWVYLNLAALMIVHLIEILYSTFRSARAVGSIHLGPPSH